MASLPKDENPQKEITSQENPSEIIEDKDNKDNTSKKKLKSKFNLLEQGRLMIIVYRKKFPKI